MMKGMKRMYERRTCMALALISLIMLTVGAVPALSSSSEGISRFTILSSVDVKGQIMGHFSDRTMLLGLTLNRDKTSLMGYTLRNSPLPDQVDQTPHRPYVLGEQVQVEIVLHGQDGKSYTQRVEGGLLCLHHGPKEPPHVIGNMILPHTKTMVAEIPRIPGFEKLEILYGDGIGYWATDLYGIDSDISISGSTAFRNETLRLTGID